MFSQHNPHRYEFEDENGREKVGYPYTVCLKRTDPAENNRHASDKAFPRVKLTRNNVRTKYGVGDFVHTISDKKDELFVGRILDFYRKKSDTYVTTLQWMYKPVDVTTGPGPENVAPDEILFSAHSDPNYVESIISPARIKFVDTRTGEWFVNRLYADPPDVDLATVKIDYVCHREYKWDPHSFIELPRQTFDKLRDFTIARAPTSKTKRRIVPKKSPSMDKTARLKPEAVSSFPENISHQPSSTSLKPPQPSTSAASEINPIAAATETFPGNDMSLTTDDKANKKLSKRFTHSLACDKPDGECGKPYCKPLNGVIAHARIALPRRSDGSIAAHCASPGCTQCVQFRRMVQLHDKGCGSNCAFPDCRYLGRVLKHGIAKQCSVIECRTCFVFRYLRFNHTCPSVASQCKFPQCPKRNTTASKAVPPGQGGIGGLRGVEDMLKKREDKKNGPLLGEVDPIPPRANARPPQALPPSSQNLAEPSAMAKKGGPQLVRNPVLRLVEPPSIHLSTAAAVGPKPKKNRHLPPPGVPAPAAVKPTIQRPPPPALPSSTLARPMEEPHATLSQPDARWMQAGRSVTSSQEDDGGLLTFNASAPSPSAKSAVPANTLRLTQSQASSLAAFPFESRIVVPEHVPCIRIGADYQAAIPAFASCTAGARTAEEEILWSPMAAGDDASYLQKEMTQLLSARGNVVPVVMQGQAAKDRAYVSSRVMFWARVTAPLNVRTGHVRVVPYDTVWSEGGHRADFVVKRAQSILSLHRTNFFLPDHLKEHAWMQLYTDTTTGGVAPVVRPHGLNDVLAEWTRREYDAFTLGLRSVNTAENAFSVLHRGWIPTRSVQDIVDMFWSSYLPGGVSNAPPGTFMCTTCGSYFVFSMLITCKRYFSCGNAVCKSCFKASFFDPAAPTHTPWRRLEKFTHLQDLDDSKDAFGMARLSLVYCEPCFTCQPNGLDHTTSSSSQRIVTTTDTGTKRKRLVLDDDEEEEIIKQPAKRANTQDDHAPLVLGSIAALVSSASNEHKQIVVRQSSRPVPLRSQGLMPSSQHMPASSQATTAFAIAGILQRYDRQQVASSEAMELIRQQLLREAEEVARMLDGGAEEEEDEL